MASGEVGTSLAARINSAPSQQQGDAVGEGLLVLVIDTNPLFWFAGDSGGGGPPPSDGGFQQLVASTLVFVNAYLLLHRSNRIVIVAAHAGRAEMLYPDATQQDTSGTAEQSAKVNASVLQKLQALGDAPLDASKPNATAIAASLSRSLCCTSVCCYCVVLVTVRLTTRYIQSSTGRSASRATSARASS